MGKDICMIMADFHCCMAEINTVLIFFFFGKTTFPL